MNREKSGPTKTTDVDEDEDDLLTGEGLAEEADLYVHDGCLRNIVELRKCCVGILDGATGTTKPMVRIIDGVEVHCGADAKMTEAG